MKIGSRDIQGFVDVIRKALRDNTLNITTTQKYALGGLAFLPIIYYFLKNKLKKYLIERTTILNDLPLVGSLRGNKKIPGTAVICGGSMAGLFAARICLDHFEDVLIIEPEAWLATKEGRTPPFNENGDLRDSSISRPPRARVQQYYSSHVLQTIYTLVLRRLFPGYDKILTESGGRLVPAISNIHFSGSRFENLAAIPPYNDYRNSDCPPRIIGSRETDEKILRDLLFRPENNARWMVGTATGLRLSASERNRVEFVDVRVTESGANEIVQVPAALVIDCSGSSQTGAKWLKRLYVGSGQEEMKSIDTIQQQYNTKMRYTNFLFYVPPEMRAKLPLPCKYDDLGEFYVNAVTKLQYLIGYSLQWHDGHRINVMFGGPGDPDFPRRPSEICDWLRKMPLDEPHPEWLYELIDMLCEMEDDVHTVILSGIPNSYVRYDLAKDIPSNFIVMGDAILRLTPSYGQGISKICLDAVTLDKLLRKSDAESLGSKNFSAQFFALQRSRIGMLWDSTKAHDYASGAATPVEGESCRKGAILSLYLKLVGLSAMNDKYVAKAAWYNRHFLVPDMYIFEPNIILKVLWAFIKLSLASITSGSKKS